MTDQLTQQVAEVLHDHYPPYCNERGCQTGGFVGGWAAHVAEVVVAALQLEEFSCGDEFWWSTPCFRVDPEGHGEAEPQ